MQRKKQTRNSTDRKEKFKMRIKMLDFNFSLLKLIFFKINFIIQFRCNFFDFTSINIVLINQFLAK